MSKSGADANNTTNEEELCANCKFPYYHHTPETACYGLGGKKFSPKSVADALTRNLELREEAIPPTPTTLEQFAGRFDETWTPEVEQTMADVIAKKYPAKPDAVPSQTAKEFIKNLPEWNNGWLHTMGELAELLEAFAASRESESQQEIPERVGERMREIFNLVFDHQISSGKAEEALYEIAAGKEPILPNVGEGHDKLETAENRGDDDELAELREIAAEIETHCPCGARPESLNTHPHVSGCPVERLVSMLNGSKLKTLQDGKDCGFGRGEPCLICEAECRRKIAEVREAKLETAEKALAEAQQGFTEIEELVLVCDDLMLLKKTYEFCRNNGDPLTKADSLILGGVLRRIEISRVDVRNLLRAKLKAMEESK